MSCPTCAACEFKKLQSLLGLQNFGEVAKYILANSEKYSHYLTEYAKLVVEGKA